MILGRSATFTVRKPLVRFLSGSNAISASIATNARNRCQFSFTNSKSMTRSILAAWVFVCCGLFSAEPTYGTVDYKQQLTDIQARIEVLNSHIAQTEDNRTDLRNQLTKIKDELKSITDKIEDAQTKIDLHNLTSNDLTKKKNNLSMKLEEQEADLESIIRGSIVISRINFLKVLFSQEDSSKLIRAVTYYRYLTQARATQIRKVNQSMRELQTINSSILERNSSVQAIQNQQSQYKQRLGKIDQQITAMIAATQAAADNQ